MAHLIYESPQLPSEADVLAAKEASHKFAALRGEWPLALMAGKLPDKVELPRIAADLLQAVLNAIANGCAVTIVPSHAELTTQQAADLLGFSRTHLVSLIEGGEIPCHRVGTHRRIRFDDLMNYKAVLYRERGAVLRRLAKLEKDMGLDT
ncbi:MAG: helix-turn-helix domain-containing protein [Pirellulaceae bacterium]|jgi:excisionase family DNA binding protein|nr:helix-turn-helix domain-containing protein [Pirellulaceae bacterium]